MIPETMMPDPEDGVVKDNDGIITDGDSGSTSDNKPGMPESTAEPGTGVSKTNGANRTAGISPSARR